MMSRVYTLVKATSNVEPNVQLYEHNVYTCTTELTHVWV
jgi:hypothetical protein